MSPSPLTGITRFLSGLHPVRDMARQDGPRCAAGLLGAARPAVAAALAEHLPAVLLVTAHPQAAADLVVEIEPWTDRPVRAFPALEVLPFERVRLDLTVLAEREAVVRAMGAEGGIVVAPIRALLQPVQPAGTREPVKVQVGEQVSPDGLLGQWTEMGYTHASVVDEPGTFARRGGVVDVFPAGAEEPVRIELFGNAVESLRRFDPATQRSTGPVEEVQVPPVVVLDQALRREALDLLLEVDVSEMDAEAQTSWLDDLARLEAGASVEDLPLFLRYLFPETSLLDCLPPGSLVVIDTAQQTWEVAEDLTAQAQEMQRSMERRGDLPAGLRPALLAVDAIRSAMAGVRQVEWLTGSNESEDVLDLSELFRTAPAYAGRLRSLVHDLSAGKSERYVLATLQSERLEELLREEGVTARRVNRLDEIPEHGVSFVPAALAEGWSLPQQGLTVLSEHEVFGRARHRAVARRQRAPRESFFAEFTPGDYVVHLEHGIGRFESVTRMAVEGVEREYALVQYAGTDRVYVPTDQLDRLTRYIGVGEAPPQLSKLGGGEWQRARQRAKQAADDIARELVELYSRRMTRPGHAFAADSPWQAQLEESFPYPETPDQERAVDEVKEDMEAARPMDRLVCADVGYGKTEVAVRAAFKAIMDGRQVAVLVPTTVLAQQHFETFRERFAGFPIRVEALSRFRTPAEQRDILRGLSAGEVDVVVGTHRLLQKDVSFSRLGLLVIDEEQRFGVRHKEQLRKLRESIDTLTLTATPIPRTLHMGLVGIREISVMETPPEGRLPIKTYLQPYDERLVREAVLRELDRDGQVYIVHNKVATIDAIGERLRQLVPEARVLVGHGQMEGSQLERVMLAFAHQEADVLLCSTIIENGLDIPNVNTIIVTSAHRLGLTQLYQLRGRVGRSANQAYAYLLYPRDAHLSHDALRRMEAVFEAQELGSGFGIAMKDLEIRGAGNLLGAEQSGHAAAIGFDLYTRMVGEAVERLRGVPVDEPPSVTIDLPLTMYLPAEYIGNETERLNLYRRLAGITSAEALQGLADEMRDRFGSPPDPVSNLLMSLQIKLDAMAARVSTLALTQDYLVVRVEPTGVFDRVSLYQRFGTEARISTNVLRISRHLIGKDAIAEVRQILIDMIRLRASVAQRSATPA